MAGRKHHFIQQLLLKGFAAATTRKGKPQVWLYQRGQKPVLVGTDNVFAQRDFYGPAPSALDAKITDSENELKAIIRDLRARTGLGVHPIGHDTGLAELIRLTGVRGRWIRTMFEEFGSGATISIAGQLTDPVSLVELLRKQIVKEPDFLKHCFEQELKKLTGRQLTVQERVGMTLLAKAVGQNLELFKDTFDPAPIQAMLRDFREGMPEVAAGGHIKGLVQSFDRTEYRQYLESFSWSVAVSDGVPYIFGDCGPLYLGAGSQPLGPMGVGKQSEVHGVVMPISVSHLIIGELDSRFISTEPGAFNRASAAWSKHGFVASERSDDCLELQAVLGSMIDRYLKSMLEEVAV